MVAGGKGNHRVGHIYRDGHDNDGAKNDGSCYPRSCMMREKQYGVVVEWINVDTTYTYNANAVVSISDTERYL